MLVPTKSLFASRTFWFNVLGAVVAVLAALQTIDLGEAAMEWVVGGLAVGNALLRYLTTQPVTVTGEETKYVASPELK